MLDDLSYVRLARDSGNGIVSLDVRSKYTK